jgi:signal peptide peptidase SppA
MHPVADLLLPAALCRAHCLAIDSQALFGVMQQFHAAAKQRQLDAPETRANPLARTSHKFTTDDNGTAHLELSGIMLDTAEPFMDWIGMDYTVTPHFTEAINKAASDANIKALVIYADTPGGSVIGLQAAYEAVRDAGKPVIFAVTGLLCSAGMYVAAGANKIIAEPAAIIGSIGTMTTITDTSDMAAQIGIKVHLIASGPQKGTGTACVPVTADRLEPMQNVVNQLAEQFKAVIVEGRKLSVDAVNTLATGEAWLAPRAKELGLIDSIASQPAAFAAQATKEFLMLSKEQYKALISTHPAHTALIDKMDNDGSDESAIKAAIVQADIALSHEKVAALQNQIASDKQAHEAALKAANEAHDKTKAELAQEKNKTKDLEAKVQKLSGVMPTYKDPGHNNPPVTKPTLKRSEFNALSVNERSKFYNLGGEITEE